MANFGMHKIFPGCLHSVVCTDTCTSILISSMIVEGKDFRVYKYQRSMCVVVYGLVAVELRVGRGTGCRCGINGLLKVPNTMP